jgi:hypothetical protein
MTLGLCVPWLAVPATATATRLNIQFADRPFDHADMNVPNPPVRSREEFRTPLGVRKSARNEPAVCGPGAYGDLRICLCRGWRTWCLLGCSSLSFRKFCRAIGTLIGGRWWAKSPMTCGIDVIDGASASPGAWGVDGRCDKAATQCRFEPGRVTGRSSRLMRGKLAVRAAASSVGRFR